MNPDTKLTLEQIKIICAIHNIQYKSHSRITTGFSHEVHRLNDDLVIKLFNTADISRFKTESAVLESDLLFLKPKLVAKGEKNEQIDRNYIIMSYVPGNALGNIWHNTTEEQREELVKTICESLQIISKINPSSIGLEEKQSWKEYIHQRLITLVTKLQTKNTINSQTAEKIVKLLERDLHVLSNSKLYPVYWDVHFDNFIVDDNFKLQAFIDMENVEMTSLDYPLAVIQKMIDEPEKYLQEEDEKYADKKDYENLKTYYKKYYPQMFTFENLETRINLYLLLDTLHLLVDWSHVQSLHKKLSDLIPS